MPDDSNNPNTRVGAMAPDASTSPVEHTPGLWGDGHEAICAKIDRERPWASTVFRKAHDGSEANALVLMTFGASVEEAVANARLSAAAPELLEALSDIIAHYGEREQGPGHSHAAKGIWDKDAGNGEKGGTPCDWCAKWDRARTAIAKARGTPPAPEVSHVG